MDKKAGQRFASARHDAGYQTAERFAEALGVSVHTVRSWEAGRSRPDNPNMDRVVELTGKPRGYFFHEEQQPDEDLAGVLERTQRQIEELRRQMDERPPVRVGADGLPEGAERVEGFVLLPVLGRVTAGRGGLAEEHIEGYRHLPITFVPPGQEKSCFLVEARGESMVDAGITSGDLLLICNAVTVNDGDVAIVESDGEAMVKRVYVREGKLLLTSDNPHFAPLTVSKGRLVGRVMKIIRDL